MRLFTSSIGARLAAVRCFSSTVPRLAVSPYAVFLRQSAGKFAGLVWFLFLLVLPSVGYVGFLHWAGVALDWGMILAGYGGLLILGASYLALGLFVSALSDNPVVTAMVTFGSLALLNAADWLSLTMEGRAARLIQFFSPMGHFRDFTLGVVDLSHVVYFIFFCLYFLFLTLRVIESRNWKG